MERLSHENVSWKINDNYLVGDSGARLAMFNCLVRCIALLARKQRTIHALGINAASF